MSGSQTFPKLSQQALDEHRQIHFHLDLLAKAIAVLDPATADAESLMNLAARIESLRERLEEHFQEEENGGLYQGILDQMPQAESDVLRLMAQHERTLQAVETARVLARRREPSEAGLLRSDLERIMEMMREHETEEEALVARALARHRD
jgi:iron-sulfur cluster repair protein YtfE (RIC family)